MALPNLQTIVLATRNRGKAREFQWLLKTLDCRILNLRDVGIDREVEETGSSFSENARLKAVTYSNWTQYPVLADDSGLEVAALEGRPGVHSARYAGVEATDEERNRKLLAELEGRGADRQARFICALALAHAGTVLVESEGECRGEIIDSPRGSNGFGYDPVFILPKLAKTFAEISPSEKNRFSHRTRAVRQLLDKLNRWYK